MNSEEKFKKQLQEKLASKEFDFNEKHWFEMADVIDRSRERKFRGGWLFALCMLCVVGTIGLYVLTGDKAPQQLAVKTTSNSTTETITAPEVLESSPVSLQPARQTKAAQPVTIKESAQPTSQPEEKPVVKPDVKPIAQSKTNPTVVYKAPIKTTIPEPEKHIAVNPPVTPVVIPPVVIPPVENPVEEPKQETKVNATLANPVVVAASTVPPETKPEKIAAQPAMEEQPIAVVSETQTAIATQETVTAEAIAASAKKDTIAIATVEENKIILPTDPDFIRHTVSAEMGLNYLAGWKANDTRDGRGFNFTAGMNYSYALTQKFALSTGLHYTEVGHLNAYRHTSRTTSYSFGEETDVTVITPQKMSYLQIPLKFNYILNDRNVFGAGYNFGYLLTVKSKVDISAEGYNYNGTHKSSIGRGYTEGFNSFDSQIALFYRRRVVKDWWLNAEVLFGIMDSRNNAFFNTPAFERNSGIKLSVIYTIFQK